MKNLTRLIAVFVLVIFSVMAFSQDRDTTREYLTFGRNPMIPGGLTAEQASQRGWEPFNAPQDIYTTMYGAYGERVTGWIESGEPVAWDRDNRLRILKCGNLTDLLRVKVEVPGETKYINVPGETEYVYLPGKDVPGPVRYRDRDVYIPIMMLAPQQQYIGNLGAPSITSPVLNGIPGLYFSKGSSVNVSNSQAQGQFQTQEQIAEAAAAAAAAAAASSSSTSTAPGAGAGSSGGSSSGSSGASGGGGSSGSGSG